MSQFHEELKTRLVRYCAIDSQSDMDSPGAPSTACQHNMLDLMVTELTEMGAQDVTKTDYGTVIATIPGTAPGPTIGFLAHVDTAPQFNATGVKPRVIEGYNGGVITYPDDPDLVLDPAAFPYLASKVGDDIVTASGLTLLGADDKAGVAIVMTAARHLLQNPDIQRPTIRVAFTPDEEIGRGVDAKLPADLGVDFAYTFDGADLGEITYETFSADFAVVTVTGVSIHPGWAKGKLVNAIHLASKIIDTLPQVTMTPETTDGTQGFIHAVDMKGSADRMELRFILRDFEREGLEAKGALLRQVCDTIAVTEPRAQITCEITPQYRNMRYWLENDMTPVDLARDALRDLGIEEKSVPIRGGTDGSRLTEMGVPCPNLFTGMQNVHGPQEWISVQDMTRATDLCLRIAERAVKAG
ncbi:peptidase T [Marivita sp. XM-24bin2]|jgi:tripeptide aminopeptidase|uniref:peptidase T n=1 Tax=unclassified Marivita TaxID=2632480 RepID=UPI000D7AEEB3|nr:peptidase T [Marivita sp. XM-24bin2]MCR9110654.1 peptidase T [Paracoccaceae bacterium]PWL34006.1 MAG: peptidase T [Marivita sp. XM-24bin2]